MCRTSGVRRPNRHTPPPSGRGQARKHRGGHAARPTTLSGTAACGAPGQGDVGRGAGPRRVGESSAPKAAPRCQGHATVLGQPGRPPAWQGLRAWGGGGGGPNPSRTGTSGVGAAIAARRRLPGPLPPGANTSGGPDVKRCRSIRRGASPGSSIVSPATARGPYPAQLAQPTAPTARRAGCRAWAVAAGPLLGDWARWSTTSGGSSRPAPTKADIHWLPHQGPSRSSQPFLFRPRSSKEGSSRATMAHLVYRPVALSAASGREFETRYAPL